jgi:hypothetical protein
VRRADNGTDIKGVFCSLYRDAQGMAQSIELFAYNPSRIFQWRYFHAAIRGENALIRDDLVAGFSGDSRANRLKSYPLEILPSLCGVCFRQALQNFLIVNFSVIVLRFLSVT